ncbi:MAG: L-aspartate oxidase [Oscillospiraceae bacterium]
MEKNYDVIIVGSGAAGLYAALNLDSRLKVLLLCKREIILSNSALAQGGIAAVFDKEHDTIEEHLHDTLVAGGFQNDPESTRLLVEQGPKDVQTLIDYDVDFDKDEKGKPHLTLEGGHTKARILHYKDCTGREIVEKLIYAVRQLKNVDIMERSIVCDLKKNGETFSIDVLKDDEHVYCNSRYCLLATGGIGRVYEYTTNSAIATGDGIALAYNLGAEIKNLNLVQFHPTAFANKHTRESFLISEAVRGEGAYLLNCNYERFMDRYDARLELAPRDVVSKSIIEEAKRTGHNEFYLDISYKDSQFVKNRFPMIYSNLLKEGYDLTKDKIPVFPCQHYLMGGIDVDTNGATTVKGLYAAGECSHTGVHGNNRLARNSLLEAVVFSRLAATDINEKSKTSTDKLTPFVFEKTNHIETVPTGIRTEIRAIMQKAHFVVPDPTETVNGFERVCELKKMLENSSYKVNRDYVEAKSLVTVAYLILKQSIQHGNK